MYSIVLTKAAFLHRDYLIAFQRTIPSDVLAMIDNGRNGEDIAMAHVVANRTKAAPVWVKVEAYETADSGISSGGKKHFSDRGKVLHTLEKTTGSFPWVLGYQKAVPINYLDLFKLLWTHGK